jgi:hypothetical protein
MPDHTRRLARAACASLAALLVVALTPAAARAQSSPQAARDARRAEMEARQRTLWELERLKKKGAAKTPDRRPLYTEVAGEFQQLQVVNYSLAGAADPKVALDYARVRKESAEVRRRAARLKSYLSLPEVEGPQRQEAAAAEIQTPEALRSAVGKLDALVNSFVWNPVFQKPDVVDLEQSAKASRDLAGILALSEQIRRSAEELAKGARGVAKR